MPTREQITSLRVAAQAIIDERDFAPIQQSIEAAATHAVDDWYEGRIKKMPVSAAFGHLIGAATIKHAGETSDPNPPLPPFKEFLLRTQAVDQRVGETIIDAIPDSCQARRDAFQYFEQQLDKVIAFERANPKIIKRRGKKPTLEPMSPHEVLISQVSGNAGRNVPSTLIRETLRIVLDEGRLPDSVELTTKLKARLGLLGSTTLMSGKAFQQLSLGRAIMQEHHRRSQSDNPEDHFELPTWVTMLEDVVQSGVMPPYASQFTPPRHGLEAEHQQNTAASVLGHCAAQFLLRPQQPELAKAFFGSHGIKLENDSFRLVDYQLLRAIDVAETTIFDDPTYRAALQLMGEAMRDQAQ